MTSYITLGHVDTIADPTVELIKKELAGATAIRRAVRQGQPNVEALHDQPFTKADPVFLLVELLVLVEGIMMLLPLMMMSMLMLKKE